MLPNLPTRPLASLPPLSKLLHPLAVDHTLAPPTKKPRTTRPIATISDELSKYIVRDSHLVATQGFEQFVHNRRYPGDFTDLHRIRHHPAHRLLRQYGHRGAPVVLSNAPWPTNKVTAALERGPHKSATEYLEFLREEMVEMVKKAQWTVLPYSQVKHFPNLRISPLGVVPQHERRPRTIVDYSFSDVNDSTLPIAPMDAMQFGRALERMIRRIVLADPRFGPVQLIKVDISDGFYRIWVRYPDIPKLGVAFPALAGEEPLIAFPLVLPMGWKNSPPLFCAATETIADLANERILKNRHPKPHRLDDIADSLPPTDNIHPPQVELAAVPLPTQRDPFLHNPRRRPVAHIDVYVDDFCGLAQGNPERLRRVRRILLTAIDDVFRPLSDSDRSSRQEPSSVKKLRQGDACWSTCKKILGWILDTAAMTISLPQRRLDRLADILADFNPNQRRVSEDKWHKILGELRSMSLALPGSRGLFSLLQEAFRHKSGNRIPVTDAIHHIINDFRWLQQQLAVRPTRLYELVALSETLVGSHDASGLGAGGVWFPSNNAIPRTTPLTHSGPCPPDNPNKLPHLGPIVWRVPFPKHVTDQLASFKNPTGPITNSDLELAGSILHHEAAAQCFDIRERTIKSDGDNSPTLFWQRKGSTTTSGPPAYLLRLQSCHQRFHRYIPLHDFISGERNVMSDDASRLFHLSNKQLLAHFDSKYPQNSSWRLWTVTPEMRSSVISALHKKWCSSESFLRDPAPPIPTGTCGLTSASSWPSIPSLTSMTPSAFSKSSHIATAQGALPPVTNPSALAQWKTPYAALHKRMRVWGPRIRAIMPMAKPTSA